MKGGTKGYASRRSVSGGDKVATLKGETGEWIENRWWKASAMASMSAESGAALARRGEAGGGGSRGEKVAEAGRGRLPMGPAVRGHGLYKKPGGVGSRRVTEAGRTGRASDQRVRDMIIRLQAQKGSEQPPSRDQGRARALRR